jgi:hypothetical protein
MAQQEQQVLAAQPLQVFSEAVVEVGQFRRLVWLGTGVNFSTVPPKKRLETTTLTLNYFPAGTGTLGRASIAGRNSASLAIWRLQVVYVEPRKTVHLTFPGALRLEAGGYVELGVSADGPGSIFISANGALMDALAPVAEQSSVADLIEKLDSLKKSGSISEQEYISLRAHLEHTHQHETVAPSF